MKALRERHGTLKRSINVRTREGTVAGLRDAVIDGSESTHYVVRGKAKTNGGHQLVTIPTTWILRVA